MPMHYGHGGKKKPPTKTAAKKPAAKKPAAKKAVAKLKAKNPNIPTEVANAIVKNKTKRA